MNDTFLDKAYGPLDPAATRQLYDDWADTYEAELGANGYATPARCAEALAKFVDDLSEPVLDFGCGTGLSGTALSEAGFTTIDGQDLSADMLAQANDKGVYRKLMHVEADSEVAQTYRAIAAIGVIGIGAAPASSIDMLMHSLPKGGHFVFSLNDHALADTSFEARVNEWVDCASATLLMREYGPHLPGLDLQANVYVLEKK